MLRIYLRTIRLPVIFLECVILSRVLVPFQGQKGSRGVREFLFVISWRIFTRVLVGSLCSLSAANNNIIDRRQEAYLCSARFAIITNGNVTKSTIIIK